MPGSPMPGYHPMANIFPMLLEERRPTFRASLAEKQNHPITLHRGLILDGRNRARELSELNKPITFVVFVGTDRDALNFVIAENLERRHLDESQRSRIADKLTTLRLGDNQHTRKPASIEAPSFLPTDEEPQKPDEPAISQSEAAEVMNVSRSGVQRAAVVREKGAPELGEAVDAGKITVSAAADIASLPIEDQRAIIAAADPKVVKEVSKKARKEQNDARRAERMDKLKAQSAGNTPLSTAQKFPVIYMDPPTKFAAGDSDRSTENHYPTMDEEQLAALPISDLALADCVLFIWTTVPWLRKTIRLLEGWGFEYVSEFVWHKEILGMGFWNRNVHETLLIATRGKIPAPDTTVLERSLYSEARSAHSAKPKKFRDIITAYYPELPKVELFPRGSLPEGWHGWGNEARLTEQQSLAIDGEEEAA